MPSTPTVSYTEDDFELQFGANHLGPFLFTKLLFPLIKLGATAESPSRIVNVSSGIQSWGAFGGIRWDDPNYKVRPDEYEKFSAYAHSKSANCLFTAGIVKRFAKDNVISYSLHPGSKFSLFYSCLLYHHLTDDCLLFSHPDSPFLLCSHPGFRRRGYVSIVPDMVSSYLTSFYPRAFQ